MGSSFDFNLKEMQTILQRLLKVPRCKFCDAVWHDVPASPGLYLVEESGNIIYIGSAEGLNTRLWQEHYLGLKVRKGGSQLREVLANVRGLDTRQVTDYIRRNCSFAVLVLDPIEKRLLKFYEKYCNAIIRPDFIEKGSEGKIWEGEKLLKNHIQYKCMCCGRTFPSGRKRRPPWYCRTCAQEHRAQGKGPLQIRNFESLS